ncbi:alpha/beta hydrolase family protein [Chamaesiphon sp.]|uniref:alpha/beta hydrolase family protein n=1 Tax=Chamaesiphon sp. TaxID=2814140 RepID=UPI0035939532
MNRSKYLYLLVLTVAIIAPIAIEFVRGNYRWQLLPALSCGLVLAISTLVLFKFKIKLPLLFSIAIGLGLIGSIASALLSYLFPVFTFPTPTGKYSVGTTSIYLVDRSRRELCDPANTSNRSLVIQVWYPTTDTSGIKAPYLADPLLIPSGTFSHLGLVKTNALLAPPIATAATPYPVIIYTPSWGGYRTDNTFQTQELASHGFVVIGLEHPCSVPMAIYPNGKVIYGNLSSDYTSSDAAFTKLLQVGEAQLILRTQDIQFVLDRLPEIAKHKLFKNNFNLTQIGIFGHSFGGAAAAQACAIDSRLKAGINMDGLLFGSAAQHGATQPFLFMNSDYPRPTAADLRPPHHPHQRSQQTDAWGYEQRDRWFRQHGGYNLTLTGSAHMNFSDYPLRSRLNQDGGKISPQRAMAIVNAYTLAFFGQELRGQPAPLLARVTPESSDRQSTSSLFPEAIFENYPQPAP